MVSLVLRLWLKSIQKNLLLRCVKKIQNFYIKLILTYILKVILNKLVLIELDRVRAYYTENLSKKSFFK